MKKSILFSLSLLIITVCSSQTIRGNWEGKLALPGQSIRFVLHITGTGDQLSATCDSPDQHAYGLTCNNVSLQADSLILGIAAVKGEYRGSWDKKDEIAGYLSQGGARLPLLLTRAGNQPAPNSPAAQVKPQTPVPPFSYAAEEVGYENDSQHVHLGGTLTKPLGNKKFPVVLLITGSGAQDRDETIGMHKPFWVIADMLAKQGIAVLRVDDRGIGKSTGDFAASSSADFATDVMAGIRYLKTRSDIDTTRIGLLGHSEGAAIAPYVAARSKDVSFIVMLAGPAVGGARTMYYQGVEKPEGLATLTERQRKAYGNLYNKFVRASIDHVPAADFKNYVTASFTEWKKQEPDSVTSAVVHGTDEQLINYFTTSFMMFTNKWWQFFLGYDFSKDIAHLKIPLLALNGEKDMQVDPKANLELIRKIVGVSGNTRSKVYEVPGVNHLFQHCKNCGSVQEYLALEETFDPATLQLIGKWIQEQTR